MQYGFQNSESFIKMTIDSLWAQEEDVTPNEASWLIHTIFRENVVDAIYPTVPDGCKASSGKDRAAHYMLPPVMEVALRD